MRGYLAAYIESRKSQKHLSREPPKPTEPGFDGFGGSITKCSIEISDEQRALTVNCPVCAIDLKREETEALTISFCPFGCPFVDYRMKPASNVVVERMLEAASVDEINAMLDALNEREAILIYNGIDQETAVKAAENDLLPIWMDRFELHERLFR